MQKWLQKKLPGILEWTFGCLTENLSFLVIVEIIFRWVGILFVGTKIYVLYSVVTENEVDWLKREGGGGDRREG